MKLRLHGLLPRLAVDRVHRLAAEGQTGGEWSPGPHDTTEDDDPAEDDVVKPADRGHW